MRDTFLTKYFSKITYIKKSKRLAQPGSCSFDRLEIAEKIIDTFPKYKIYSQIIKKAHTVGPPTDMDLETQTAQEAREAVTRDEYKQSVPGSE